MSEPPADAETFLAVTEAIAALQPSLSPLEAGILAALHLTLAADSRSFARVFGVEHALVLRAVEALAGEAGLITETGRTRTTQRARYEPSAAGSALIGHLHG